MYDGEVRDDGVVHVLPEERGRVQAIEAHAVGYLDEVELFFLRQDFIDVGFEEWVGFEDFGSDAALDRGFDFGFRAWCESVQGILVVARVDGGIGYVLTLF